MSKARVNNVLKQLDDIVSKLYNEHPDSKNLKRKYKKEVKPELRTVLENELPKGKQRKVKDPNAVKRPKSAYMYFVEDKRDEAIKHLNKKNNIKEGSEDDFRKKPTKVAAYLGEQWQKLKTKPSAKKYIEKASSDKERYEKEKNERVEETE